MRKNTHGSKRWPEDGRSAKWVREVLLRELKGRQASGHLKTGTAEGFEGTLH